MRGRRNPQLTMLAFIDLEERIPSAHPLQTIKQLADKALADLSSVFDKMSPGTVGLRSRRSGS